MNQNIRIRKNVFETNSSSSHSLTMSAGDIVSLPFSPEVLRTGKVVVDKGEYGWEWYRYYSPLSKAEYLLTQVVSDDSVPKDGTPEEATRALRDENSRFDQLCRVIEAHTGVMLLIRPGTSGYIDHDSVGNGSELFESDEKLAQFLFSADSYIETGNDNSGPRKVISTDRGDEHYYGASYRQPEKDWVTVQLVSTERWVYQMCVPGGADLFEEAHAALLAEVRASATVTAVRVESVGYWHPFAYCDPEGTTMSSLQEMGFHFSESLVVSATHEKRPMSDAESKKVTYVLQMPADVADKLKQLPPVKLVKKSDKQEG